jgi:hypothetical protein
MKYLHQILKLKKGTHIRVHFSQPSKVLLLTSSNYLLYKNHVTYTYYGGVLEQSPYDFEVPSDGVWHVVVERGGYFNPKNIEASVNILSN